MCFPEDGCVLSPTEPPRNTFQNSNINYGTASRRPSPSEQVAMAEGSNAPCKKSENLKEDPVAQFTGARSVVPPSVRQRTSQACDKCRERKTKCSGHRPVCLRCTNRGLICEYSIRETRTRAPLRRTHHVPRVDTHNIDYISQTRPAPAHHSRMGGGRTNAFIPALTDSRNPARSYFLPQSGTTDEPNQSANRGRRLPLHQQPSTAFIQRASYASVPISRPYVSAGALGTSEVSGVPLNYNPPYSAPDQPSHPPPRINEADNRVMHANFTTMSLQASLRQFDFGMSGLPQLPPVQPPPQYIQSTNMPAFRRAMPSRAAFSSCTTGDSPFYIPRYTGNNGAAYLDFSEGRYPSPLVSDTDHSSVSTILSESDLMEPRIELACPTPYIPIDSDAFMAKAYDCDAGIDHELFDMARSSPQAHGPHYDIAPTPNNDGHFW
ncbi:hypothetical protein GALMADRAFT_135123 [Galerina marginata CBS 339.88]|uniref:Zn(2)-C6 fungal-type domain-containing protein n=1 Tax=Galerina marginata (strain CBS 339.88) TaxID=685588 RepID=A0A067TEX3_GALM3|nr:hypothetical protein GALMADRAFT_135123 [Galerina marginata CBS 339.88]